MLLSWSVLLTVFYHFYQESLPKIGEMEFGRSTFKPYRPSRVLDKAALERLEKGLTEVAAITEMKSLLMLEAQLSLFYWRIFKGIPITDV